MGVQSQKCFFLISDKHVGGFGHWAGVFLLLHVGRQSSPKAGPGFLMDISLVTPQKLGGRSSAVLKEFQLTKYSCCTARSGWCIPSFIPCPGRCWKSGNKAGDPLVELHVSTGSCCQNFLCSLCR